MIICKACELKQEPTPKCGGCGICLFPQHCLPRGFQQDHPKVLAMLPFIYIPDVPT